MILAPRLGEDRGDVDVARDGVHDVPHALLVGVLARPHQRERHDGRRLGEVAPQQARALARLNAGHALHAGLRRRGGAAGAALLGPEVAQARVERPLVDTHHSALGLPGALRRRDAALILRRRRAVVAARAGEAVALAGDGAREHAREVQARRVRPRRAQHLGHVEDVLHVHPIDELVRRVRLARGAAALAHPLVDELHPQRRVRHARGVAGHRIQVAAGAPREGRRRRAHLLAVQLPQNRLQRLRGVRHLAHVEAVLGGVQRRQRHAQPVRRQHAALAEGVLGEQRLERAVHALVLAEVHRPVRQEPLAERGEVPEALQRRVEEAVVLPIKVPEALVRRRLAQARRALQIKVHAQPRLRRQAERLRLLPILHGDGLAVAHGAAKVGGGPLLRLSGSRA
mmetsp:Transcript_24365/g.76412  ORF Transcript_24365/g.76412 Transcript_24365/m.76412 type:complete len:399 (-) Transcript_24365:121-1317(-)